jgi:hypothetical protein
MDKEKIKKKIEEFEYNSSGIKYNNGSDVRIVNLKIFKKEKKAVCDVIFNCFGDNGNMNEERYNECEYDLTKPLFKDLIE